MADELMSGGLPLFVPTENHAQNLGSDRDRFMVNPEATSAHALSMYRFLGALLGLCIRTQQQLPLRLPPLFWKRLLQAPVAQQDLLEVDAATCRSLVELAEMPQEDFEECFADSYFVVEDRCGAVVGELLPGGAATAVTWENRKDYIALLGKYVLERGALQEDMIREGLVAVMPQTVLDFCSWQDVESWVCGVQEISVAALQATATYHLPLQHGHRLVTMFWEVVGSMSNADRSQLLRFISGRICPPVFLNLFRAEECLHEDDQLPTSHTCFYQLELPAYSSADIMRKKLLYAIYNCAAMDTDVG